MTDDERALITAVCAAPDDDAPRWVYADWCEEHGRAERAELIRVQFALERNWSCSRFMYSCGEFLPTLAQLAEEGCEERCRPWARLKLREQQLLSAHAALWGAHYPFSAAANNVCIWRKGFIEEARVTWARWWLDGDHVRAVRTMPLRRVVLGGKCPAALYHFGGARHRYVWFVDAAALSYSVTTSGTLVRDHGTQLGPAYLPREIMDLLHGHPMVGSVVRFRVEYDSKAAALDDLCRACLEYARSKAGV